MGFMQHLTRDQLLELLARARAENEQDWLILLVAYCHGLRVSEAISLTPQNFLDGYLGIQRLKGSKKTVQRLREDENELLNERAAIDRWLARHRELHAGDGRGKRLFPLSRFQADRIIRRYGRAAGIPRHLCHFHVLKHTVAMEVIREAGIEMVRQFLGHQSIASTGRYLAVSDEAATEAVFAAMRKRK